MKKLILLISISTIPIILLYAQQSLPPDSIAKRLFTQTTLFQQENIYTQTDKSDYVAGDTIWFRTYLVNPISHKPENASRYVYAELIDVQTDSLICRIKARKDEKDMIYGYIPIPLTLPQKIYHFKTYTKYGCNWGEDGAYSKWIRVYSTTKKEDVKTKSKPEDYNVAFLPEGGQAIDGQICRFAFKAERSTGQGENIQGIITDEKGDTITKFVSLHCGMGEVAFVPLAEKKYYAQCIDSKGVKKQFVLPKARMNLAALKIATNTKQCIVTIVHDSLFSTDSLQLVVLQRGQPYYVDYWNKREYIVFSKEKFTTGIVHFLLLTTQGKIVSERLAFINHTKNNLLNLSATPQSFTPRQLVNITIELKDSLQTVLNGNCSIAVTDAADVPVDKTKNILSTLLLTADLKGEIEAPEWYFEGIYSKEKEKAMDLVMMTNGWKRYDLQATIDGKYTSPSLLPEMSSEITGFVKSRSGNPIEKAMIKIHALGTTLIESLTTDSKGFFCLSGLEIPDSIKFLITAVSTKYKKNITLNINKERYISLQNSCHPSEANGSQLLSLPNEEKYIYKATRNFKYNDGMRHYMLGEVKVTANKIPKAYKTEYEHDADITIKEDRIKKSPGLLNLDLALRSIAGFYFYNDNSKNANACIILDGMPIYEKPYIEQIMHSFDPTNIEQIDIIKGPKAVAYLDAKRNCIVAITTKRGEQGFNTRFIDTNMAMWSPLGYQQPAEIYSPHYDQLSTDNNKPDLRTTIYWKPDIILKDGKATISFFTADSPSTYQVVAEGISSDGKVFRKEMKLFQTGE